MSWSWSHTHEAYANVEKNIQLQPRQWLETVYAEWCALDNEDEHDESGFNLGRYTEALAVAKSMTDMELADFIWDKTNELRRCENGGHLAHCCPYGCLCHMVSFDHEGDNPIPAQPE